MPGHPLAALYVYGAYALGLLYAALIILRHQLVEDTARDAGIPPGVYRAMLLVFVTLLWPVIAMVLIARNVARRRGGRS